MGSSRPTIRCYNLSLLVFFMLIFFLILVATHVIILRACYVNPEMLLFCDIMQVVVSQLNFVERSVSPVALYDRDSNSGNYSYYKPSHIRAMFPIVCNVHVSVLCPCR